MNTAFLWIVFPGLMAVIFLIFRNRSRFIPILGALTAIAIASSATWVRLAERWTIGPLSITINDTWIFLGRRFELGTGDRPVVIILYLAAAFWFAAVPVIEVNSLFVPLGLGMTALLTAAIAVNPFLYAAMLIEMAVLISIPFLTQPGERAGRGVLRYLTYQTLGMPFILFTGWMLAGVETGTASLQLIGRASILLALGFTFLLAVFPFHTWIPMIIQESNPFPAAFVLLMLPGAVLFLAIGFLGRFAWLRTSETTYQALRAAGLLMVISAGLWAAFQRDLARILGYAVILEIGFSLVAISLSEEAGSSRFLEILFASLMPRGLAMGLWSLALAVIRSHRGSLRLEDVRGAAWDHPVASAGLLLANFSLAGLPLLASFPVRLALLEGLGETSSLAAFGALLGSIGLLAGGLRTLSSLITGPEERVWRSFESWSQRLYLGIGGVALLLVGLFPQFFLLFFAKMPSVFGLPAP